MKRVLVFAFFCALTLTCIASCGFFAPPDGYLSKTPTSVYYLQFTEKNGQLLGNLEGIYETNTALPGEQTINYPFTGVHVNNSISLTLTEYFSFTKHSPEHLMEVLSCYKYLNQMDH